MAVLGSGFDPGVTNVFAAYAQKHLFDEIHYLDILDCNAGTHGHAFATNFNPEINIREVTQAVRHWENGKWIETPAIIDEGSVHFGFDYPVAGARKAICSIMRNLNRSLERKRAQEGQFLDDLFGELPDAPQGPQECRHDEDRRGGLRRMQKIVPIQFLKALLPEPASLGTKYSGKTVIGNIMTGTKDGKTISRYIYNVCDHEDAFNETGTQAIAYTTGVPAMIGAMMVMTGVWQGTGVFNIEEFDPEPFMDRTEQVRASLAGCGTSSGSR